VSLSNEAENQLVSMYDTLTDKIRAEKQWNTIWEFSFNKDGNARLSMYYSAAAEYVDSSVVAELKNNGLIRDSKDVNQYILTAKGVYQAETILRIDTLTNILVAVDDRFFEPKVTKISEREKIILFSMMMMRCFSKEYCIDARKDKDTKDEWMQIFIESQNQLKKMKVIKVKTPLEKLGKKSDIEDPMSNIIRHTDALDKKVKMLYKKTGKNQYYLDMLYKDRTINVESLAFILDSIFEGSIGYAQINEIADFCRDALHVHGVRVFDYSEENFSTPDCDDAINNALVLLASRQTASSNQE